MLAGVYTVVLQKRQNYPHFGIFIGRDIPSGLYVVTIEPNSPAAQAHIQPGDRVLAINGQLVSSFFENPTDIVYRLANQTEKLTLSLTRSNTIKFAGLFPENSHSQHISQTNGYLPNGYLPNGFERDFDSILSKNLYQYDSNRIYDNYVQHSHQRRKRRTKKNIETQTSFTNVIQELNDTSSRQRSIPNMGTSHKILRNNQSNLKETTSNDSHDGKISVSSPARISPPKEDISPPLELSNPLIFPRESHQSVPDTGTASSSFDGDDDGIHEVRLVRAPNFRGFGFHLQYNRVFYMIHHVEPNSPAQMAGLRARDVILQINNQSTNGMLHKTFIEIISTNLQIILLVQSYEKYIRNNPEALTDPPPPSPLISYEKKTENSRFRNPFTRAFSKLKHR